MFSCCYSLVSIDLSSFDTSNVLNMQSMFSGCNSLVSLDLSNFNTSKVERMGSMFVNCWSLIYINISNFITINVNSTGEMFKNCSKLTNVDLSNFDTSKVTNFGNMFFNCASLTTINLSNFNTLSAQMMDNMFNGCILLKELNLSNFNTINVTKFEKMFYNCKSLISLDIVNFNTVKATNMKEMFCNCISLKSLNMFNINAKSLNNIDNLFSNCTSLTSLDLSLLDTSHLAQTLNLFRDCINLEYINLSNAIIKENVLSNNKYAFLNTAKNLVICIQNISNISLMNLDECNVIDCSENWREKQKKINKENDKCEDDCISLNYKYEYLSKCYNSCPNKTFNNNFTSADCHPDCKTCNGSYNDNNTNCLSCSSEDKFLNLGNCVSECKNGYYNDTEDSSIKRCKCDLENCFSCSIESLNDNNSYIICNEEKGYFPLYDDKFNRYNNIPFIECNKNPKGYYLDKIESNYKKCYETYKDCNISGNETYHNCIECEDNYSYEILFEKHKNCYINCSYYYYLDNNTNKYYCTEEKKCKGKYNKLINGERKCIEECYQISRYEFRNECYIECPQGSNKSEEKQFYCIVICNEEKPFELVDKQECVNNCSLSQLNSKICIIKYQTKKEKKQENEITAQDIILENFEREFTSEDYDTYELDNGEEEIFEDKLMTITLTTTEIQRRNNNDNHTKINLGKCEQLLRQYYKIPDEKKLYIKKIDIPQEGMKIPKIEYNIYFKLFDTNLIKLNLTTCENTRIDLTIPIVINEDIDKLNSSSGYYNDICYTTTSDCGTDISLKDRKEDFVENNKTVCQEDCIFSEYDYKTQKAKCSCNVKESSLFFVDMKINKSLLYKNFIDIKNIANVNILVCYRELFSKKGLLHNIGFYVLIILEIFHFICIIIFYKNDFNTLEEKIKNITFAIDNWALVKPKKRKKIKKRKKRGAIKKETNDINIISNQKSEIASIKKKIKRKKGTKKGMIVPIEDNNISDNNINNNIKNNNNPPITKKSKYKLTINNNINELNNIKNEENEVSNNIQPNSNSKIELNPEPNEDIKEKIKNIMELDDEELNNLSYQLAIKKDNRTFCQYYISLIRTKHLLIFSFYNKRDYNSRIIKIDLFIIGFAIYYTVNALFFSDETMHTIYKEKGDFNFIYQLPQIIYSSVISAVLNVLLKLLGLSEGSISEFKKDKNKEELNKKEKDLLSNIKNKAILYFIISFVFLLSFWYYVSMFCAIYANAQIHLIKDTLISFGLSLLYPIIIYLFPGIFRIPALADKENEKPCMYKFSTILQMI